MAALLDICCGLRYGVGGCNIVGVSQKLTGGSNYDYDRLCWCNGWNDEYRRMKYGRDGVSDRWECGRCDGGIYYIYDTSMIGWRIK